MSSTPSLRRSLLSYTSATVFCRFAAIVQSLIVIRWLEPAELGVWLGLQLITIYGAHAHLGVFNAVNRELPYHLGRDEGERAAHIENVARGWLLIVMAGGFVAVALMSISGLGSSERGRGAIWILFAAIVTLGVQFHAGVFRARNRFGRAGLADVVNALVILAGLPLVYYWRYDGLLWRVAIAAIISLLACFAMNGWNFRTDFDWNALVGLVRRGMPILVVVLGMAAFTAMDRTLILWLLDDQAMGHYALCFAIARILKLFPTTFGQIFYPRMTAIYSAEGMSRKLLRRCTQASALSGAVVLGLAVGALVTMPWAVERIFPKYTAGIPALRIALIAYVVLSLAAGPTYFLISTVQKRRQLLALAAATLVMVGWASQLATRSLEGIAWSLVVGASVYVGALWALVLASTRGRTVAR